MAKIRVSFLRIKQTNLVYLSYLADLRKKKRNGLENYLNKI